MRWENFSGLVSLPRGQDRGLPAGRKTVGDSYRFTPTFYRGDAWQVTVETGSVGALLNRDTDPRW